MHLLTHSYAARSKDDIVCRVARLEKETANSLN